MGGDVEVLEHTVSLVTAVLDSPEATFEQDLQRQFALALVDAGAVPWPPPTACPHCSQALPQIQKL